MTPQEVRELVRLLTSIGSTAHQKDYIDTLTRDEVSKLGLSLAIASTCNYDELAIINACIDALNHSERRLAAFYLEGIKNQLSRLEKTESL